MHFGTDIVAFGITVVVILTIGLSTLRRSGLSVPLKLQLEELPPEKLSSSQSRFLAQ